MPKLRRVRSVAAVLAAAALYLVHSYPAIRQYEAGWLEDREAEERYSRYRALRALSSTPCRYSPARHHPALAVWTRRDVAEVYQQLEAGCRDTGSYEAAVEVLYSTVQYSTVQYSTVLAGVYMYSAVPGEPHLRPAADCAGRGGGARAGGPQQDGGGGRVELQPRHHHVGQH